MKIDQGKRVLHKISLVHRNASPIAEDILVDVLFNAGFDLSELIESKVDRKKYLSVYLSSAQKAQVLTRRIKGLKLRQVAVRCDKILKRDWEGRWKVGLKPFRLTPMIDVVPVWSKKFYRPNKRHPVYLNFVNAFGTGRHESTKFMAGLIERCRGQFTTFLDVGTGTGILSMTALFYGAKRVDALDINPDSVKAAKGNLEYNKLKFRKIQTVDVGKFQVREKYDFVAANLITHDLLRSRKKLMSFVKSGGYLAVSGVSRENYPKFKAAWKKLPLKCLKIEKGKDWVAELYRRR